MPPAAEKPLELPDLLACKDKCPDAACFRLQCLAPAKNNRARFRLTLDPECLEGKPLEFFALTIGDRCYP